MSLHLSKCHIVGNHMTRLILLSFQIIQDNEIQRIAEDFVALVPAQSMYITKEWMNHAQSG